MSDDDQPSAGRLEDGEHVLPIRIYYEDTDFTGVVYHANYVRYFERGRSDFLRLAGVSHADMFAGDLALAFAVVRMEIDFARAAAIDDALVVRTRFSALRGPRFFIDQIIERGEERIAHARIDIEMSRLLCLKAADVMDRAGNKEARNEIAMIKVQAPLMALRILDDAIQAHGGGGVSDDFPLAHAWAQIRTLRFADGPDEVHMRAIARAEFGKYAPPKTA